MTEQKNLIHARAKVLSNKPDISQIQIEKKETKDKTIKTNKNHPRTCKSSKERKHTRTHENETIEKNNHSRENSRNNWKK